MSEADLVLRIAARGDGVTGDGRHVPLSAPGDRLLPGGGLAHGPHHQAPPCVHFPTCGGCQLQQLDETAWGHYVRDRVAGALAGQDVAADEIAAPHLSPPRTRRRAALRAMRTRSGVQIGFSSEGSHRIVDMTMCAVLDPRLFALVAPLRALLAPLLGERRQAQVKLALVDQGVDCLIEGLVADSLAASEALNDFAAAQGLARLTIDAGDGPQLRWAPEPATVRPGGVAVDSPPFAFLQATADGEAALVAEAARGIGDARTLADLFAGLGTFALALGEGRKVYAAEAARDLVMALRAAGGRARPGMLMADHRDLFRRPLTPEELNRFDAVLIDPPRAGAREQVVALAASSVKRLVYVSCNPSSFARDARTLVAGGYRLERVRPVGQFRWSTHVELVGTFGR